MKDVLSAMWHTTVANAQVGITYFFLIGFFVCLILQGMGVFKIDVTTKLFDALTMVIAFWFMRQRESSSKDNGQKTGDAK